MAEFQDGAQSARQIDGKWKPGGRGRPPKSNKPPEEGAQTAASSVGELPGNPGENAGEFETPDTSTAPPSAYELRRNPATYPRSPHTGLPVPLYRVTRTEDDLANYLAAMRPEDWGHCEMYVYRYCPRARVAPGENAYVEKITQGPVNLTQFIEEYGSGLYGFTLNDANVQGNRRTAMYAKVELHRDDYPMKYDLATLDVDHKDNKQLVARLIRDGILNSKGEVMANDSTAGMAQVVDKLTNALLEASKQQNRAPVTPPPDPNAAAMAAVQAKTIDMLGAANKAAIDAATAGNKSGGADETLKLVTTIMALVKPAEESPFMRLMMEELKANREATKLAADAAENERRRNHELQIKAMEQKAAAADPFEQIERVMKIRNLFGGGDSGPVAPRNWKEQGLQMLGEHLPQILDVGAALVKGIGRPDPVGVGGAGGATPGGQPQPQPPAQIPAPMAPPATTSPSPQSTGAASTPTTNPDGTPITEEQQQTVERIRYLQGQLIEHGAHMVRAITNGKTGDEFAELMIGAFGPVAYERARGYTAEEWLTAIFSFPELRTQFAGAEHMVQQFVEEFLTYGDSPAPDGDGDNDGDNEPEPPAPPLTSTAPTNTAKPRAPRGKKAQG